MLPEFTPHCHRDLLVVGVGFVPGLSSDILLACPGKGEVIPRDPLSAPLPASTGPGLCFVSVLFPFMVSTCQGYFQVTVGHQHYVMDGGWHRVCH
jgi:hypothetical protein